MNWTPPIELSEIEEKIVRRTKKARNFFVFLREHRHHILSEEFEQKLIDTYRQEEGGKAPALPGQLAIATLLQAYCHVSDHEAIERAVMDKRWQMVLHCLDCEEPPFSQATLVNFRNRMITYNLDKELLDRTVAVAEEYGGFGPRPLRALLDSSPLFGAARVEDTFNLLGHALSKAVTVAAKELNTPEEAVITGAGLLLVGRSSLKAALDLDWGEPDAKSQALSQILEELARWKQWVEQHQEVSSPALPLKEAMETIEQILEQDTDPDPAKGSKGRKIKQEVAKDRRISIEDKEMRHGRKSRSKCFNGFKQHLLVDVESLVIKDVVVRPANEPEQDAIDSFGDVLEPASGLNQFTIDLGYAGHPKIREWESQGVTSITRPWPQHERGVFSKNEFLLDFATMRITCPAGEEIPMVLGTTVHFPASRCQTCELRKHCMSGTPNKYRGRGVTIRSDEEVQQARREAMKTVEGRAKLRTRVGVEHRISHQVASQGRKARYLGTRKNQYDGRRHAAVINLQLAQQYYEKRQELPKAA